MMLFVGFPGVNPTYGDERSHSVDNNNIGQYSFFNHVLYYAKISMKIAKY
ncbi:MAG: hypothetical protein F6K42_29420 [Leptolyngbya sp. SIO1D8]|nr:hypothetical protein [Leptolyngbya sp. SIO1D8]